MKSLLPQSLPGQLAVVMAAALLVASAVNFFIVLGERQRAVFIEQTAGPIARFSDLASALIDRPPPVTGRQSLDRFRRFRYSLQKTSPVTGFSLPRDAAVEDRLASGLRESGVENPRVLASVRSVDRQDPLGDRLSDLMMDGGMAPGPPPRLNGQALAARRPNASLEVVLSVQLPDGRWLSSLTHQPQAARGDALLIGASTAVTFIFVLGAALWIAGRLARPLRDLATAAGQVGDSGEPHQVVARGPGDVQQTIHAFNAMSRRVSQLLREKDVMLGALGHDLRTPLASLRIRLESMEPEAEREKAVRTIEETGALLDDILELSRHGRSQESEKHMDAAALARDVADDYIDTGSPVSLGELRKTVIACRPVLLRRALRNLIDNAISYGGAARLSVLQEGDQAVVNVDDDGPGMSHEELTSATEPFFRGDQSRSRTTGGAGLGLTLADAIVRAHGGTLALENRSPRGLRATLRIPMQGKVKAP